MGGIGGEELKWHQLAQHQLMNQSRKSIYWTQYSKMNDNSTNLRKRISIGISVAFASVYSEKASVKKLVMMMMKMIIIIMNSK